MAFDQPNFKNARRHAIQLTSTCARTNFLGRLTISDRCKADENSHPPLTFYDNKSRYSSFDYHLVRTSLEIPKTRSYIVARPSAVLQTGSSNAMRFVGTRFRNVETSSRQLMILSSSFIGYLDRIFRTLVFTPFSRHARSTSRFSRIEFRQPAVLIPPIRISTRISGK